MKHGNENSVDFSGIVSLDETSAPFPIFMGSACNLNCAYCSLQNGNLPAVVPLEQVTAQLSAAAREGAPSVIFIGGEPTLHKTLPACMELAREFSFSSIGLRTNGMMFLYPEYVDRLKSHGLSFVQISHLCHDQDLFDTLVNVTGAHGHVAEGAAAIARAGFHVSATIPLLRATFPHILENVNYILNEFETIKSIELRMTGYGRRDCAPVRIQDMEGLLPDVAALCQERGARISFGPFEGIPPCLFRNPAQLWRLFRYPAARYFPRPQFNKKSGCTGCPLNALCNGVRDEYLDDFRLNVGCRVDQKLAAAITRAAVIKRRQHRVTQSSPAATLEPVTMAYGTTPGGQPVINECIVRINFKCNQDCLFCFVDTHCAGPPEDVMRKTRETLIQAEERIRIISISGGEPALNPRLDDYVRAFHQVGARELCLQTNAALFTDPERAATLAACGLDSAFVSLHSHDAVTSDLITGQNGAFHRTVEGIHNLSRNGIFVYISHVINAFNYATLPEFVEFVGDQLQGVPIVFSFVAPHRHDMMFSGTVPRLSQVRAPLTTALHLCLERRIPFSGLPGMCGMPLCILGPDLRFYPDIHPVNPSAIEGVMHKNSGCAACSLTPWCYGLREFYATLYGDEELAPVHLEGIEPKLRDMESRLDFFKAYFD